MLLSGLRATGFGADSCRREVCERAIDPEHRPYCGPTCERIAKVIRVQPAGPDKPDAVFGWLHVKAKEAQR